MIVGIDINILGRGGGVANYILQLLNNIKNLNDKNEYKLYYNSQKQINIPVYNQFFQITPSKLPTNLLEYSWRYLRFPPVEWFTGQIDIFHSPAHSPVYAYCPPAKKWVVTVHDLFTFKLNYAKKTQVQERRVLKIMEKKACRVIAVSQSTRDDLIEMVPGLASRTVVIHEGVDERFFSADDKTEIFKKYGIQSPYILYVGAADAHKNLLRLVNVYKRLSDIFPHSLVLAGKITERHRPVMELVKELNLNDRVVFTNTVSTDDLPGIYKKADLFILPSLYEGFGLVLLEALACGTPVVASRISSIPEVVGDAGEFFDPYNEDNMYDVCRDVLSDFELRKKMRILGISRARQFSWRRMTEETLKVYEEVSGK